MDSGGSFGAPAPQGQWFGHPGSSQGVRAASDAVRIGAGAKLGVRPNAGCLPASTTSFPLAAPGKHRGVGL